MEIPLVEFRDPSVERIEEVREVVQKRTSGIQGHGGWNHK